MVKLIDYADQIDALLDADHDGDGLIDEGDGDDIEEVRFKLVGELLMERLPNYATEDQDDYLTESVLCNHVREFKCKKMDSNLLEIKLNLSNGENEVELKTRVIARFVDSG